METITENVVLTSNLYRKEREYWKEKMSGDFMLSCIKPDHMTGGRQMREVKASLEPSTVKRLYDMCSKEALGLYVLLLSGVDFVIHNHSGCGDFVVGMPSYKEEAEKSLYPIRTIFQSNWTIRDLILDLNKSVEEALNHSALSFPVIMRLIERAGDENMQVTVALEKLHGEDIFSGSDISFLFRSSEDSIELSVHYNEGYFQEHTANKLARCISRFFDLAVEDTGNALKEIYLYTQEELDQVLLQFNATDRPYDQTKVVHQLFEEQAGKTPDLPALKQHASSVSYGELNKKANQLARILKQKGIKAGSTVAVMMDRSFDLFISMFGVLKAGGAFLLLDPEYPAERMKYMIENSEANLLLTKSKYMFYVSAACEKLTLDEQDLSGWDDDDMDPEVRPEDPAYIVYTSGSTGVPKGVKISHSSFVNLMYALEERIEYPCGSTILALTTITFDIFMLESIYPLTKGVKVVIADETETANLSALSDMIVKENIEIIQNTPSRLKMLLRNIDSDYTLRGVRTLMVGGEAFLPDLYDQIKLKTDARIFNMYGPIETTVWTTVKEIKGREDINIGTPLANTYIYILDGNKVPVPVGVPGELCVSGRGLAQGYINNEALTKERFIANPLPPQYIRSGVNDKLYCTGDLAVWLPNRDIQFIGRTDYQIKLRGYRIELGEIEEVLLRHENISEAAVVVKEGKDGEQHLYAYIAADLSLSSKTLKEFLSTYLPPYMIPAYFILMDKLPTTLNGKIDRKYLTELEDQIDREASYVAPRTELEQKLVELWEKVLQVEKIGIDDEFELLGGDSLMAMKLELEMELNDLEITNVDILQNRTIRKLAEFIESKETDKHQ